MTATTAAAAATTDQAPGVTELPALPALPEGVGAGVEQDVVIVANVSPLGWHPPAANAARSVVDITVPPVPASQSALVLYLL